MVYDCFQFNNELDMLEIRLNHHAQFVDRFILTECTYTYSGQSKFPIYDRVKDFKAFAPFKDMIIHRVYDRVPGVKTAWEYEHDQRNYLRTFYFKKHDLILYLDCDEIIRDKKVIEEAQYFDGISTLNMKACWYYLNCMPEPGFVSQTDYSLEECFRNGWTMGKACFKKHLKRVRNLYEIRQMFLKDKSKTKVIANAGWHFSNLGDGTSIYEKLQAFSHHKELSDRYNLSPAAIDRRRKDLKDPLGRDVQFVATELDVPEYVLKNLDKFKEFILDPPNTQES